MNKSKIKNIALGVSLGLNILLGFFLGGGLISSCTAKKAENPASSVVDDANGEIPALNYYEPLKAVSTLQTGVNYVFPESLSISTQASDSFQFETYDPSTGEEVDFYGFMQCRTSGGGGGSQPSLDYGASSSAGDYADAWTSSDGWWVSTDAYIRLLSLPTNEDLLAFLKANLSVYGTAPESSSEPVATSELPPVGSYEVGEHIGLSADYDFRRWFGNVDPNVGVIGNSYNVVTSVVYGGLEWVAGDGLTYNAISFILQPLQADNAFIVSSDYVAKTAQAIYGADYVKYAMLSAIYYLHIPDYDGAPIYNATGDNYPDFDYRTRVYFMPLVAGTLDGTNNGVNALDLRGFAVDKVYRSFDVIADGGNRFNTFAYDNVNLSTMLKNDFTTIVSFGNVDTNPFTLLSSAFSSVGGILSIAILPNLTLGALIFIPLVVTIILAIVRLLQK